ncbi:MAG: GNAT family N-acetyltransferase [Pseudomonadota bacterium]
MFDTPRSEALPMALLDPPPWLTEPVDPFGLIPKPLAKGPAMTPTITIQREDTDTKARYVATVDGVDGEGEMTLSKVSASLIIVDHTLVDDSLRGMGIAAALAQRLIKDARAAGQRIVPLCPFFRGYAEKHREEVSDVVQW